MREMGRKVRGSRAFVQTCLQLPLYVHELAWQSVAEPTLVASQGRQLSGLPAAWYLALQACYASWRASVKTILPGPATTWLGVWVFQETREDVRCPIAQWKLVSLPAPPKVQGCVRNQTRPPWVLPPKAHCETLQKSDLLCCPSGRLVQARA